MGHIYPHIWPMYARMHAPFAAPMWPMYAPIYGPWLPYMAHVCAHAYPIAAPMWPMYARMHALLLLYTWPMYEPITASKYGPCISLIAPRMHGLLLR